MPQAARSLVVEWREADARAREAEGALATARQAFAGGAGPEPSMELHAEARLLRKLADAKLRAAITALGKAAKP